MSIPRILICGGRNYSDRNKMFQALDEICLERGWISDFDQYGNFLPVVKVISGMARGADTLAVDWAIINWCSWEEYPANWNKYGKSAGYIRNKQMLDEGKPDLVVAFPGGKGTKNMVELAKKALVDVIEID